MGRGLMRVSQVLMPRKGAFPTTAGGSRRYCGRASARVAEPGLRPVDLDCQPHHLRQTQEAVRAAPALRRKRDLRLAREEREDPGGRVQEVGGTPAPRVGQPRRQDLRAGRCCGNHPRGTEDRLRASPARVRERGGRPEVHDHDGRDHDGLAQEALGPALCSSG